MSQHVFAAAISLQPECIQDLIFHGIGDGGSIHILDFTLVLVLAMCFYLLLIIQPLVRKDISAVHTTNRNDHGFYLNRGKGGPQFLWPHFYESDGCVRSHP